ncbi:MAG: sulfotransferase [Gammaproteobacteria bacterium]|nr:sulfotransferase [Gammaproteobacteria bacterium]NNL99370.1 sulfotransferase [Gammaproteobacteria bacterium]
MGFLQNTIFGTAEARAEARAARADAADLAARLADADQRWEFSPAPSDNDEPVFIFSAGWRSGSTLLQRMVMAERSALIWGEPFDRSQIIQSMADQWRGFTGAWPRDRYIAPPGDHNAVDDWVANFYPTPDALRQAHLSCLNRLFKTPAAERGYARWGLKEIRLRIEHAVFLKWLYPNARFLFLLRHPQRAYASYRPWRKWHRAWPDRPVMTPYAFASFWREMATDFVQGHARIGGLLVRYEELEANVDRMSEYLGINVARPADLPVRRGRDAAPDRRVPWAETAIISVATATARRMAGYD